MMIPHRLAGSGTTRRRPLSVMPAKAGIQRPSHCRLGSRLRGNDDRVGLQRMINRGRNASPAVRNGDIERTAA